MQPNGTLIQTEEDFNRKYWFSPEQLIVVTNPLDNDFVFTVEQRKYQVPKKSQQQMTGFIANVYLDQMSRIVAQNDNKFEHMIDPALRAQYYDSLILSINDVIPQYVESKPYLNQENTANVPQPFAHLNVAQSNNQPDPAPYQPEQVTVEEPVAQPAPQPANPPQDHSFDLNGSKYEVRHVEDQPFYTRDGQPIEANEYYQAVSMI